MVSLSSHSFYIGKKGKINGIYKKDYHKSSRK
nr:MAG TPA: hypothetical protein [Caudoviricetes sp.]